jgi:hypothetical protein
MVELQIHASNVDGETTKQIYAMRDHPAANGLIAMMPDCHAGAGRGLGSRGAVKRMLRDGILTMEQFEKEMEGIYSTSVKPSTIDESSFAYKPFSQLKSTLRKQSRSMRLLNLFTI